MDLLFHYEGDDALDEGFHTGITIDPNVEHTAFAGFPTYSWLFLAGAGRAAVSYNAVVGANEELFGFFHFQAPSEITSRIEIVSLLSDTLAPYISLSLDNDPSGGYQISLLGSDGTVLGSAPVLINPYDGVVGNLYIKKTPSGKTVGLLLRPWQNDSMGSEYWLLDHGTIELPNTAISRVEFGRTNASGASDGFIMDDLGFLKSSEIDFANAPIYLGSIHEFPEGPPDGTSSMHWGSNEDLPFLVGDGISLAYGGLSPHPTNPGIDGAFTLLTSVSDVGYLQPPIQTQGPEDTLGVQVYFLKNNVLSVDQDFIRFVGPLGETVLSVSFLGGVLDGKLALSAAGLQISSGPIDPIIWLTWYRLEAQIDPLNGLARVGLFDLGGETPIWNSDWISGITFPEGPISLRLGKHEPYDLGEIAFDEVVVSPLIPTPDGWFPPSPYGSASPAPGAPPPGNPFDPPPTPPGGAIHEAGTGKAMYLYSGNNLYYVGYYPHEPFTPDMSHTNFNYVYDVQMGFGVEPPKANTEAHAFLYSDHRLDWLTPKTSGWGFWEEWLFDMGLLV